MRKDQYEKNAQLLVLKAVHYVFTENKCEERFI